MSLESKIKHAKKTNWPCNGLSRFQVIMLVHKAKKQAKNSRKKCNKSKDELNDKKSQSSKLPDMHDIYEYIDKVYDTRNCTDYKNVILTSDKNGKVTAIYKDEDKLDKEDK